MPALARTSQTQQTTPRGAAPDAPLAPSSFRERGVVLPATTPAFAFARVRDGVGGREMVMRNPAGTRGAMMIPLAKLTDFARPTLHDRALLDDLGRMPRLGPAQVAAIARAAARAGLAGRSALAAASAAGEAEGRAARWALARMLTDLAAAGGTIAPDDDAADDPKAFAARHHGAIARAGAERGLAADAVVAALARLAPRAAAAARLTSLLPRLRMFASSTADTAALLPEELGEEATFIGSAATATIGFAEEALRAPLAVLAGPLEAIARNAADPAWPGVALERTAWILDGWAALLARWEDSAGQGQAAEARAIRVIAAAAPPLPADLALSPEARARARCTWRQQAPALAGGNDQPLLERIRIAVP